MILVWFAFDGYRLTVWFQISRYAHAVMVGREVAGKGRFTFIRRLVNVACHVSEDSMIREDGWSKGSLPV